MNVTVEILSRSASDQPFTTLVAPSSLAMTGGSLGYTPSLPGGSGGLELRLRAQSANGFSVDVGSGIDPANPPQPTPIIENGVTVGMAPAAAPLRMATFGAWGGQPRDVPFGPRQSFLFRRVGVSA